MDLIDQMRALYRRRPRLLIGILLICAIVGIVVGFRVVGPALFGR